MKIIRKKSHLLIFKEYSGSENLLSLIISKTKVAKKKKRFSKTSLIKNLYSNTISIKEIIHLWEY